MMLLGLELETDVVLLGFMGVVFLALALVLLVTIEWRNWPLMGLLLLSTGVVLLIARSLLVRTDLAGWETELLWMWRGYAASGGVLVLSGLVSGLRLQLPPPSPSLVRVLAGLGVLILSGCAANVLIRITG